MIYAYRCRSCGATADSTTRGDILAQCECGGLMNRDYSHIRFDKVMQAGYNQTLGKEVSSIAKFKQELRRESDIRSNQLGMDHQFEMVDPHDKVALGVTDEGIDASNRIRAKQGLPTFRISGSLVDVIPCTCRC